MKTYDPSTPKAELAALSMMMAVVTMAAMVFAPSVLEAVHADSAVLSGVTPNPLVDNAIAVVARPAASAGRSSPSSIGRASGGNS